MSLKIFDLLFFGPVEIINYEYKKNKKPSLIIVVKKEGKNYDPKFYAIHIIKANNENIKIINYFKDEKIKLDLGVCSLFIREYDYQLENLLNKDYQLIKDKLDVKNYLLISY